MFCSGVDHSFTVLDPTALCFIPTNQTVYGSNERCSESAERHVAWPTLLCEAATQGEEECPIAINRTRLSLYPL
jgi:hypothetical protein